MQIDDYIIYVVRCAHDNKREFIYTLVVCHKKLLHQAIEKTRLECEHRC